MNQKIQGLNIKARSCTGTEKIEKALSLNFEELQESDDFWKTPGLNSKAHV